MNQSSVQRNPYCYSWHEANIRGLQVRNKNKPIKDKIETHPYTKSIYTTKCVISPLSRINMTTKCGIALLLKLHMNDLPGLEPGVFSM